MAQNGEEELIINVLCQCNSTRRTTPLFFKDCVLDNLEKHEFIEQLLFEIPQTQTEFIRLFDNSDWHL